MFAKKEKHSIHTAQYSGGSLNIYSRGQVKLQLNLRISFITPQSEIPHNHLYSWIGSHAEWFQPFWLHSDFAGTGVWAEPCGVQPAKINGISWPCAPEMSSGAAGHCALLGSEPFNQLLSLHSSRRESQCCAWVLFELPTCNATVNDCSIRFLKKEMSDMEIQMISSHYL